MTNSEANRNKVLYVTDKGFNPSSASFCWAVDYAQAQALELHILYVSPELKPLSYSTSAETVESINTQMREAADRKLIDALRQSHPELTFKQHIVVGKLFFEAIRFAVANGCALVIKQSEDPPWLSAIFSSDDMHLVRKCPCPVLLVPPSWSPKKMLKNIAIAVDFSDDEIELSLNKELLLQATLFQKDTDTTLHLISVYDSSLAGFASLWVDNPDKLEQSFLNDEYQRRQYAARELLDQMQSGSAVKPNVVRHIVEGQPERTLPQMVEEVNADLVVMGTVGRSGVLGMLIGNTAETVLFQLQCPVLAIKPEGFHSPLQI